MNYKSFTIKYYPNFQFLFSTIFENLNIEKSSYRSYTQMRFKLDISTGQEHLGIKLIDENLLSILKFQN
jgi:hypothetical protein